MNQVTYRQFREADAADVKALINEAFGIDRYMPRPDLLHSGLDVYLRDCLLASSWTRVAVLDGRVVGVIMGRVKDQPRFPGALRSKLLKWAHTAKIAVTALNHLPTVAQYLKFGGSYRRLREAASVPLTDELTLFAVGASTRGLGVGSTLYRDFQAYLRAHGRTDYFLYTDTDCTYSFYEHRGMTRAAEEDMELHLGDKSETLGVFIYAGQAGE